MANLFTFTFGPFGAMFGPGMGYAPSAYSASRRGGSARPGDPNYIAWAPAAPFVIKAAKERMRTDRYALHGLAVRPRRDRPRRKPLEPELHPLAVKKRKHESVKEEERQDEGKTGISNKKRRSNRHSAKRRKEKARAAAAAAAAAPPRTTPDLPVEILERIFNYVLDDHELAHREVVRVEDRWYTPCEKHAPFSIMPLLLASRRLHAVAISCLYTQVTLNWRNSRAFCRQVPLEYCGLVKHLVYECDGNIEIARHGIEKDLRTLAIRFACRNRDNRRRRGSESSSIDQVERLATKEPEIDAMDTSAEVEVEQQIAESRPQSGQRSTRKTSGSAYEPLEAQDCPMTAMPSVTQLTIRTIGQQRYGRIPKVARISKYHCILSLLDLTDPDVITVEVDIRDPRFIMHAFKPLIKEYYKFYFGCLFNAISEHRRARQPREKGIILDMDSWDLFDAKDTFSQARQDRSNAAFHQLDDLAAKQLMMMLNETNYFDTIKLVNFSDQFKRRLQRRMITQQANRKYVLKEVETDLELSRKPPS